MFNDRIKIRERWRALNSLSITLLIILLEKDTHDFFFVLALSVGEQGTSSKLEELVETSIMCKEKQHENEPLNYYCQNCKVCICDKCGQTRHANHTKVDIKQAAEEQKLKMAELVQEMKVEITEHTTQMEKTTEMLKKNGEKLAAARNKVLTTVEELIRVLKEHEIEMVTKLDVIENEQQRDYSTQLEHFQISAMQLKTSVELCERIIEGNNSVEILEAQQGVMEKCKGLLNARKINIYKPSHVQYKTNGKDIQNVRRALLGEVIVSTTDPLQSVAEGKGLKQAEAGREAGLTITTKNAEGQQYYNEIDQIVVNVRTPSEQELDTNIADNKDGKYSVSYTPKCDGHHDVMIEVNGQPLTSSPWSVDVKPHQYHAVRSFGSRGKAQGKFHGPFDIAINAESGNIAVADAYNKRVQLFSSDGIYLREYGQKGLDPKKLDRPVSVAFNKSGDVTICDSGGIFCFTECGQFIKNISNKHLINPGDMTITCDGRMLVCDDGDNKVKVLSPDGAELMQSFSAPGCHGYPWVALLHQDTFYVSYGLAHCVKVFNNIGEFLYDIGTEGRGTLYCPAGLAVDKFNNLVVCDTENCNLQIFKLEGKFVNSIKGDATELKEPWTVTVSNSGKLFITDIGKHCVHIFE